MAFADVTIYPGTSTLAAVICGRDTVLRGKALKIQSAVRDEAARHVASGDFLKSIKVATVPYRSKRGERQRRICLLGRPWLLLDRTWSLCRY